MNKNTILAFLVAAASMVVISCTDTSQEMTFINQEAQIDKYITDKYKDSTIVRNEGSNRIIINKSDTPLSLAKGDSLSLYYSGYIFTSQPTTMFYTNNPYVSKAYGDTLPQQIHFGKDKLIEGLENGLEGMNLHEHSLIVFTGKYGYRDGALGGIPDGSALLFEVWIDGIKKN